MQISVIIPVLNEEMTIESCLIPFQNLKEVEVLVVDGGSCDRTQSLVESAGFALLLISDRVGRAFQLNKGAVNASGKILLFLHADTRLPEKWVEQVLESMSDPKVVGGRFQLEFSEKTWVFRVIAFFSTLRSRYFGLTYGDQAIYVRNEVFKKVGGFPPLMLFEDSEFCSLVSKLGLFVMLGSNVCSSTRRWRKGGIFRTILRMWVLRLLYFCFISDLRLNRWYEQTR